MTFIINYDEIEQRDQLSQLASQSCRGTTQPECYINRKKNILKKIKQLIDEYSFKVFVQSDRAVVRFFSLFKYYMRDIIFYIQFDQHLYQYILHGPFQMITHKWDLRGRYKSSKPLASCIGGLSCFTKRNISSFFTEIEKARSSNLITKRKMLYQKVLFLQVKLSYCRMRFLWGGEEVS